MSQGESNFPTTTSVVSSGAAATLASAVQAETTATAALVIRLALNLSPRPIRWASFNESVEQHQACDRRLPSGELPPTMKLAGWIVCDPDRLASLGKVVCKRSAIKHDLPNSWSGRTPGRTAAVSQPTACMCERGGAPTAPGLLGASDKGLCQRVSLRRMPCTAALNSRIHRRALTSLC